MKLDIISVFVKKLYSLINDEEDNIFKCVIWNKYKKNIGFSIIDNYSFHKKCIEKKVTRSNNIKSLFRQLNNYGFRYIHGFWYHKKNYFYKNSTYLNKIKYKEYLKIKSEKLLKEQNTVETSKQIQSGFSSYYKDNNTILDATKNFICDELFNSIEFDISKDELEFLYDSEIF